MSRYAVGIDLGTTNCALAYVDLHEARRKPAKIKTFEVPQLVELDETGSRPLLPSFLYLPADHEQPSITATLPWDEPKSLLGEVARRQGTRVPGRLVASAKSWLCHAGVDREAAILPWGAEEEIAKVSPVEVSSALLKHLRNAWNHHFASNNEKLRLEHQQLVLTVPASFDEVARELTVKAANEAGLKNFHLLEEPQAAFYQWLQTKPEATSDGQPALPTGTSCVVVDCGGGTTDFSLIGVVEREGKAGYERLAVGEHLLLGGDNMDLTVARHIEQQLSPNRRLDSAQWGNLVAASRRAKEVLLGPEPPESQTVTIAGRGRKVIGGSLRYELNRPLLRTLTLDGFFPTVGFGEEPVQTARTGLQEYGLPYVADPAITRHLATFLRQHADTIQSHSPEQSIAPYAVLFNGGVFNADACRDRVLQVMNSWYGSGWEPVVLQTASLDLSVARGAAYYAYVRATGAQRIKSGAARSYYIEVGKSSDEDASGTVLCVVPHGLEELETVTIDEPPMELQLGQPVSFPIYSSTVRPQDHAGQLLSVAPGQMHELPAVTTVLRGGRRAGQKRVQVQLEATITEIGTLELYCASTDGNNRWKLQFQLRQQPGSLEEASRTTDQTLTETWSHEQLAEAEQAIHAAFPPTRTKDASLVQQLPKQIEKAVEIRRSDWPTPMLRGLWDTLLELSSRRGYSPEHEWRWYNLVGYCLRPGWGDPLDAFRVEQLWKVVHQGVLQTKADRPWTEYWILFRRVSGGLDASRQSAIAKRMLAYVLPGRKAPRRIGTHELAEIWRALSSMELIESKRKVELGKLLVKQLKKQGPSPYTFWSLARLGARVSLYGPINNVVAPKEAEEWVQFLLELDELSEQHSQERNFTVCQLSRMSGDRARDIDEDLRSKIVGFLHGQDASSHWIQMVQETTELDQSEQTRLLGDAVPPGLTLIES